MEHELILLDAFTVVCIQHSMTPAIGEQEIRRQIAQLSESAWATHAIQTVGRVHGIEFYHSAKVSVEKHGFRLGEPQTKLLVAALAKIAAMRGTITASEYFS